MNVNQEFLDRIRGLPNEQKLIQEYKKVRHHLEWVLIQVDKKRAHIRELEYDIHSLLHGDFCPHRFTKTIPDPSGGTDRTKICLMCDQEV